MFKAVLLLSLAAVALAQPNWFNNIVGSNTLNTVSGYRVQYDDPNDIVLFVNRDSCYIVEAESDRTWDRLIRDRDDLRRFEDDVLDMIRDDRGVTRISNSDAASKYDSRLEEWECRRKEVYVVSYRAPSN